MNEYKIGNDNNAPRLTLSKDEFRVILDDEHFLALHDLTVDKIYTLNKRDKSWKFPPGSRTDVIFMLTGFQL